MVRNPLPTSSAALCWAGVSGGGSWPSGSPAAVAVTGAGSAASSAWRSPFSTA
jgi:hypothetical protein